MGGEGDGDNSAEKCGEIVWGWGTTWWDGEGMGMGHAGGMGWGVDGG